MNQGGMRLVDLRGLLNKLIDLMGEPWTEGTPMEDAVIEVSSAINEEIEQREAAEKA